MSLSNQHDPDVVPAPVRNDELTCVATIRRTIGASRERVWENVRDWEHLPWLHDAAFSDITCKGEGAWGWRAEVVYRGSTARSNIELLIDDARQRYVTRVVDGAGAGGEIWTSLSPRSQHETDIVVEFCRELAADEDADAVGAGYVALYTRLWDEDEAMMQERQRELDRRGEREAQGEAAIDLGPAAELRSRLPLDLEAFGGRVRVYAKEGRFEVHGLVCPHLLGPLDACETDEAVLVCPWHGYRFDRDSGRSCDGQRYRVANPARVEVSRDRVRLVPA